MDHSKRIIKFHGLEVSDLVIRYIARKDGAPDTLKIEEFDAIKDEQICQTINVQVVSDYVTITFYRNESDNVIIRRELIPTHAVEHIWINDLEK
jgi:hypothetical protein